MPIDKKKYETMLAEIVSAASKAATVEESRQIVKKCISKSSIDKGATLEGCWSEASEIKPEDKTNGLAMAISLADVAACDTLLTFLNKEDLNEIDLCVLGYRQRYSPLHLALDPLANIEYLREYGYNMSMVAGSSSFFKDTESQVAITDKLRTIVRSLLKKGANPNLLPCDIEAGERKTSDYASHYQNPPMAAGTGRGCGYLPDSILTILRAECLLYGADLTVFGSSFHPDDSCIRIAAKEALSQFIQARPFMQKQMSTTLHPSVKAKFVEIMAESTKLLTSENDPVDDASADEVFNASFTANK